MKFLVLYWLFVTFCHLTGDLKVTLWMKKKVHTWMCISVFCINTLKAWDKLDKKLIGMVAFNVNQKHNPSVFKTTWTFLHHPLTSTLVGVGVWSCKFPCSCSSHNPSEVLVWPMWKNFLSSNNTETTGAIKLYFSFSFLYKSWWSPLLISDKINWPLQKSLFHRKMVLLSPANTQPTGVT